MLLLTCWAAAHWQWDSLFPDSEVWEILGGRCFSLHHSPYSPMRCTLGNRCVRHLLVSAVCLLPHYSPPVVPPPPSLLVLAHVLSGRRCLPAHPRLVHGPPFEGHHPHSFWEKPTHVERSGQPFTTLFFLKKQLYADASPSPWGKFLCLDRGQVDVGGSHKPPSEMLSSRRRNRRLIQLFLGRLPGTEHRLICHTAEGEEEKEQTSTRVLKSSDTTLHV